MKLPINHKVELICENCDKRFDKLLTIENIDCVGSYERQMGVESQYEFYCEVKCKCCGHTWEVNGEIWEYPEGVLNDIVIK